MNSTSPVPPQSGFDIPLVVNNTFITSRISAVICISCSFICVIIVIAHRFYKKSVYTFYSWSVGDRFIIYVALCDGLYNIVQMCQNLHVYIIRTHVHPQWLCTLYGFTQIEFSSSQICLVNVAAINSCLLMCFKKQVNYGKYDQKLLLYVFGEPFLIGTIITVLGHFGPSVTTW